MSRSDRGDRRSQRVARLRRDGGRENALIKPFLTTPQSPTVTAPLTRGADTGFFDTLKGLKKPFISKSPNFYGCAVGTYLPDIVVGIGPYCNKHRMLARRLIRQIDFCVEHTVVKL